jgi:hypothetical protein
LDVSNVFVCSRQYVGNIALVDRSKELGKRQPNKGEIGNKEYLYFFVLNMDASLFAQTVKLLTHDILIYF